MSETEKDHGSTKMQRVLGSRTKKLTKAIDNVKAGVVGENIDETTGSLDYEEALGELAASEKRRRILLAVGAMIILVIIAVAIITGMKLHSQARVDSILNQLDGTTWVYKDNGSSTQRAQYREYNALYFALSESTGAMQCRTQELESIVTNKWSDVQSRDVEIAFDGNTALLTISTTDNSKTYIWTYEVTLSDADEVQGLIGPTKISGNGFTGDKAKAYADNYEKTENSGKWVKTKTSFAKLTASDFRETNQSNSSTRSSN